MFVWTLAFVLKNELRTDYALILISTPFVNLWMNFDSFKINSLLSTFPS